MGARRRDTPTRLRAVTGTLGVWLLLAGCASPSVPAPEYRRHQQARPVEPGPPAGATQAPSETRPTSPDPALPGGGADGVVRPSDTPPGPRADVAETDLAIGPGDLIEITVLHVPELERLELRIPQQGSVALPLLGPLPAAGYTAVELESEIRRRLQEKYMHDPVVSVFVVEQRSAESGRQREQRREHNSAGRSTGTP
jgi:hypothetical protein